MKKVLSKFTAMFLAVLTAATVLPMSAFAAQAPSGLTAAVDDWDDISLSWSETNADKYNVYMSADGANYSLLGQTYSAYYDFSASAKGSYSFYVTAVDESYKYDDNGGYVLVTDESSPSNTASVNYYDAGNVYCSAYHSGKNIEISWSDYFENSNPYAKLDGYLIFMRKNGGSFELLATVGAGSYTSADWSYYDYSYSYAIGDAPGTYDFAVCTYAVINGQTLYTCDFTEYSTEQVYAAAPTLTTKTSSQIIKWKKYGGVDSYEIWQSSNGKSKRVATVGGSKSSCTVKNVNNYKKDYSYEVVAIVNGAVAFRTQSAYSGDPEARFRAAKKLKKKKNSVKVINTRGKKNSTAWTVTLSKKDKSTLQKFAKKHFKKGWSNYRKLNYTLEWINKNVKYAKGKTYNKIASCTYVDAIFNKKAGQCLQYNGAYAMMLTYLGYEARIIQGWRGRSMKNKWSHYWCEIKIDGKWYLMETGNYDDSGDWSYFCETYRNASGYIMNKKVMK